jgi:hypothetical protein
MSDSDANGGGFVFKLAPCLTLAEPDDAGIYLRLAINLPNLSASSVVTHLLVRIPQLLGSSRCRRLWQVVCRAAFVWAGQDGGDDATEP